jgi:hypothetical protein
MLGAPQNGTPNPKAYKSCMLARGWRYSHDEAKQASRNDAHHATKTPGGWNDPDRRAP